MEEELKPYPQKKIGTHLLVTFNANGNGLQPTDFAAKLLGKTSTGHLLFGYSRLPGVQYLEPILSTLAPTVINANTLSVEVQNFGQVPSTKTTLTVYTNKNDHQK